MKTGNFFAMWLRDDAARILLGLPAAVTPSRWAIIGKFLDYEPGIGLWIHVNQVRETKPGGKEEVSWTVEPPECLIFWNQVTTVQALESWEQGRTAGFRSR